MVYIYTVKLLLKNNLKEQNWENVLNLTLIYYLKDMWGVFFFALFNVRKLPISFIVNCIFKFFNVSTLAFSRNMVWRLGGVNFCENGAPS